MVQSKTPKAKEWLDEASRRLASLCDSFASRAEDFDALLTPEQTGTAMALMKQVQQSQAPKMGTTVNAEITLLWENSGERFKTYVQRDGSAVFFHNKTEVPQSVFIDSVARVSA
jgi:hypothetical protein